MSQENNFIPSQDGYKPLTPFKLFVKSNFPFIEATYEALDNYGLYCKVVEYLNTVIENENTVESNVGALYDAFVSLNNYVSDYFDNLDVQEEINNKLDDLAEDGTLTSLISGYLQPFINSVNNEINNFDRRLSSVASGSPKAVSSINEMTDTTKIYVLISDGYWYYYNGTSWERGGIYQGTQISDDSVTYNKLDEELKEDLQPYSEIITNKWTAGKFINNNGVEQTASSTSYIEIPVRAFDKYKIDILYLTSVFGTQGVVYMFKNNDTIISFKKANELIIDSNNRIKETIEIPYDANKLLINAYTLYNNFRTNTSNVLKIEKYNIHNINKDQLDEKLQSLFNDQYVIVTPTLYVNNAYIAVDDVVAYNGYNVYTYDVEPGEKYKITSKQLYNNPILYFGNPNADLVRTLNDNPYTFQSIDEYIRGESGQQFTDYDFTIPAYCNKIYMNATSLSSLILKKSTNYKVNAENVDLQDIENKINILKDKTILFVGDSICAATTPGVKGWATLIQENNPNTIIYNYGQDGATIADNGSDTNDVVTKIETMYSEHPNADYIIIQGGINDLWQEIPLGTFEENSNFNSFTPYDKTTFSGALEYILHYALTHFKGKKIGYIVTQKIYHGGGFENYMERAKEICNKWSIPYIDLFNSGDMNYLIEQQRQDFSITNSVPTGDGCHPNLAGYKIITPKIENWLKYTI